MIAARRFGGLFFARLPAPTIRITTTTITMIDDDQDHDPDDDEKKAFRTERLFCLSYSVYEKGTANTLRASKIVVNT